MNLLWNCSWSLLGILKMLCKNDWVTWRVCNCLLGRAGGRIILLGTSTSIFIEHTDMDRGDSDRIHRVSKKCRTWPREKVVPRRQVLWSSGFGRRPWWKSQTSTCRDQAFPVGHARLPHLCHSSCCNRKRPYQFYCYLQQVTYIYIYIT